MSTIKPFFWLRDYRASFFSLKGGGGGGGVQGQKSWIHDFEITGDQVGPPSVSTFWWGFDAPDSYGYL